MIRRIVTLGVQGWQQVRRHSELWFVVVLAVALPALLLYSTLSILGAAATNNATAEKARIGTIQSSLETVLLESNADVRLLTAVATKLRSEYADIRDITIVREESAGLLVLVGSADTVGTTIAEASNLYRVAHTQPGESFIYEVYSNSERRWQVYRVVELGAERYYIHSEHSFVAADSKLSHRLWASYAQLALVVVFLLTFAYWTAKQIDFKARYNDSQSALRDHELFTSTIVHELRAPLTALRGYASMIEEAPDVPDPHKVHAEQIKRSSARLIALISDYLEVTRLRSGTSAPAIAPLEVAPAIERVVSELSPSAYEKGLTLTVTAPKAVTLESNEKFFSQIVTNLLSNAIKYTPTGHITITVTDEPRWVEVRIKDTGTGMSAEDQKRLFAPFSRVGNTATQSITGSGLGMWITKLMVEQLRGTIGVESIKGVGTHVVVRFKKSLK